jgi:hypothetical protein
MKGANAPIFAHKVFSTLFAEYNVVRVEASPARYD